MGMLVRSIGAVVVAVVLLLAMPAAAQQRIALAIGNGAYKGAPLKNPPNDARAVAEKLRALGFDVMLETDLGQREMNRAVARFGDKVKEAGKAVALFYYAGHGLQVNGRNFLVPVDAEITSEGTARVEGIDADTVLAQLQGANGGTNLVILDACRNNPFERRFRGGGTGLAAIDAPTGTLIAYATSPGKVAADGSGDNGTYTAALLKYLGEPGLTAEEVFKRVRVEVMKDTGEAQTPWESSSLTGDFYFAPKATPPALTPKTASEPSPPAAASDRAEVAYWETMRDSKDPEDFKDYLEQFPNGRYASLAKRRLAALEAKPAAAPAERTAALPPEVPPPAFRTPHASFDCQRAAQPDELVICADPGLADLDAALGQRYQAALAAGSAGTQERLKEEQRAWIGQRNRTCNVDRTTHITAANRDALVQCFTRMVTARLRALAR